MFGIWGHPEAARLTYYGLYALQHRGQESAGISAMGPSGVETHRGMGLVSDVFDNAAVARLPGTAAIGHVRYSTFGSSRLANAQPLTVRYRRGWLALAHNGNLVNAVEIRQRLEDEGSIFQTTVDTEVIAHLLARLGGTSPDEALAGALNVVRGGYALVTLGNGRLIGARDPLGIRPLSLGRLDGAWVLASETCAFDTIGAEFVDEVAPGEIVCIDGDILRRRPGAHPAARSALCAFEYIYFARPDSILRGRGVHAVRKEFGRELAREHPVPADVVIGVPDSSLSAAAGFAEAAGLPCEMGLVKNRYIGRTFIQPSQELRSFGVRIKLNAMRSIVNGRRVVLVDDSIVRGTTSRRIVEILRDAGAREVHLRIASPPYRYPCYYGIDTSAAGQLVATGRQVDEVARLVGDDSLGYLGLPGLLRAAGGESLGFCVACFTGEYPCDIGSNTARFFWDGEGEGEGSS